ncbi:PAS domain protein [Sulfitobacter sp. THAF37]|uniref:PAS domain-containing protein n=1 Tax=Sulfitobacter sp. THAF37 TaxID=2587855 RepID=UPI0012A908ED|nr:PAS domain-containing protein [Sulfitobacter sp. THAF37]QFT60001.1 PAS domain protein [Sulfitobacter sp. THAF37]
MDNSHHTSQNVIAMSEYQPESGYAAIAQIEAYWEALRGSRMVPKRSEIDPRGIEGALENAFIVERVAAGIARLRIAGSHLNDLMGMEVRGMPLTALFAPPARQEVSKTIEEVFQAPGTATFKLTAPAAEGRPEGEARMILLPLKSDLGDVSRLLGCLVYRGTIGLAPRRLDVVDRSFTMLLPGGDAQPIRGFEPRPDRADSTGVPGFAAPAPEFERRGTGNRDTDGGGRPGKRPPYLRLVKSDD